MILYSIVGAMIVCGVLLLLVAAHDAKHPE